MLDARVRKIVEASDPQQPIAFLVEVNASDEMKAIRGIGDMSERREALTALFDRVKTPVVDMIESYSDEGLRVINPLEGSLQLIAEGPADIWDKAIRDHEDLFASKAVELVPNDSYAVPL